MGYNANTLDQLEQVKALTISQWLVILRLHVKRLAPQKSGLSIAASFRRRAPIFNHPIYIDAELEHTALTLEHPGSIELKELAKLLEKLRALCKTRQLAWKELPWAYVLVAIKESSSSRPSLGQEPSLIKTLESGESSLITVSAFQKHILRRIELQAKLVERVGLGRSGNISTEIQHRLSLVWAMIRNDEFDTGIFPTPESQYGPDNGLENKFDTDTFLAPVSQNEPDNRPDNRSGSNSHTTFTSRRGTHVFQEPTQTNGWRPLVNAWHQKVFHGLPVDYVSFRTPGTPDHQPGWLVTPTILGEPNLMYATADPTLSKAIEESARLIATSGHCVSYLF